MKVPLTRLFLTVPLLTSMGCGWFGKDEDSPSGPEVPNEASEKSPDSSNSPPGPGAAPPAALPPSPSAPTPRDSASFALSQRLTPEQISNQLLASTGYRFGFPAGDGQFLDLVTEVYGVTLGGVDFETTSFRDPLTKVQTVLMVRTIAWSFAKSVLWWEHEDEKNPKKLFIHTDIFQDLPRQGEGLESWNAQIEEIYWRFYSRKVTESERKALSESFLAVRESYSEKNSWEQNWYAWAATLYSLLSTMEFWSI